MILPIVFTASYYDTIIFRVSTTSLLKAKNSYMLRLAEVVIILSSCSRQYCCCYCWAKQLQAANPNDTATGTHPQLTCCSYAVKSDKSIEAGGSTADHSSESVWKEATFTICIRMQWFLRDCPVVSICWNSIIAKYCFKIESKVNLSFRHIIKTILWSLKFNWVTL